jgi:hypothetical protein
MKKHPNQARPNRNKTKPGRARKLPGESVKFVIQAPDGSQYTEFELPKPLHDAVVRACRDMNWSFSTFFNSAVECAIEGFDPDLVSKLEAQRKGGVR